MQRRWYSLGLMPFVMILTSACGGNEAQWREVTDDLGSTAIALRMDNALNPNALNPNGLNPHALDPSALARHPLAGSSLAPSARAALTEDGEAGELSRQLTRYLVSCALDATQSLELSWTDAGGALHAESFPGLLGLVPSWVDAPLDETEQQWVSACIASRTNWYGVTVTISSRGPLPALDTDDEERSSYGREEGAFWGNVFVSPPALYSCHNEPNKTHSRVWMRDCAAGHLDAGGGIKQCGIIRIVGDCDTRCEPRASDDHYRPSCTHKPGAWSSRLITTFLP